jgi:hypothetical protein
MSLLRDTAHLMPTLMAVLTMAMAMALVTMPMLRASTILLLPTLTLRSTLTTAAQAMHLALHQPLILLAAQLLSHSMDTTLRTRLFPHHIGDSQTKLLSSQLTILRHTLHLPLPPAALFRRIVQPHQLALATLLLLRPPWNLSERCTYPQLWRLTCITACLNLFETCPLQHFFILHLHNHVFLHCPKIPTQCSCRHVPDSCFPRVRDLRRPAII